LMRGGLILDSAGRAERVSKLFEAHLARVGGVVSFARVLDGVDGFVVLNPALS
jgi:hypothetical protein